VGMSKQAQNLLSPTVTSDTLHCYHIFAGTNFKTDVVLAHNYAEP
jgi:hypothetical protein